MKNSYALITGASSGIGLEIAKNLAARGYNLILTARRKELLESLAKEITDKNSIHVDLISMDLSKYDAPKEIFQFCQSKDYQIDLLVNNMHTAIQWVTEIVQNPKLKYDQLNTLAWKDQILSYVDNTAPDRAYFLDSIPKLSISTDKCKGYKKRWNMHKNYFFKKYNYQK